MSLRCCVQKKGTDGRTHRWKTNTTEPRTLCACKPQLVINRCITKGLANTHTRPRNKGLLNHGIVQIASHPDKKEIAKSPRQKKKKKKRNLSLLHSCKKLKPGRTPSSCGNGEVLVAAVRYLTACLLRR